MAGAFPDQAARAVAACTRTLAGDADGVADVPATAAATLGGLRAFGDRLAIRVRFHDPAIHQRNRAEAPAGTWLFDALELARLDALGARWLAGIARNLTTHPGAEDDGWRWLAFGLFAPRGAPPDKASLVEAARATLPAPLMNRLRGLGSLIEDQERFASAAAAWTRDALPHVRPPSAREAVSPFAPLSRLRVRHLPKRGDPGPTSAPLVRRESTPGEGEGTADGGAVESSAGAVRYRAYTTAYDRVVHAADLASREELARLRLKLQDELSAIRPVIARLAKRLMRVLMARQVREWRFDLDEGVIDASRLAPLVASPGSARPFKAESDSPFPATVVTLLIDHSGSMRGRPMLIAALTVEIFARVLERCGVRCEVLGFTTREWDGGEPAREWAANGYPESPGRLNALEHIVIKSADVPWRRARTGLGLFLRDEMLKENIDGEAVRWAHARLLARPEPRRILVVVSDGTPMDEATMAANGHEYLEAHLQSVVEEIETRSPVRIAAIGIGHDVSAFYRNATRIATIDELGPALSAKLTVLLAR